MRSPFLYLKNFIGIGFRKARFLSAFSAGAVQTFDKLHVEIYKKGSVRLGSYNQNRGNLYLVADGGDLKIGSHCFFNTGTCITAAQSVTIGDNCKFGNNVVIVDHDHDFRNKTDAEFISSEVVIEDDVWVGAGAVILRGTHIGKGAVIGAGSIIKGKIEPNAIIIQKRSADIHN
ncbi:MAG: acyltransferase [Butyrivibrio sp.]|nr:acyltransferase [Butyrivibrio sp.]